jgi:hypothetical protein
MHRKLCFSFNCFIKKIDFLKFSNKIPRKMAHESDSKENVDFSSGIEELFDFSSKKS